ncbi:hypothetical protein GCM10011369_29870 [Neiella marina]|uniref:Uncharacterized protein n=1 Tax=Neiella marina TaxID=508461 RepID=A0A8J2XQQ4_9GAMM|nr:type I-F CRISPR-associated protein Csy2 [Neiella marina]GGA85861.1 hypothetical protein GCM10011369_29870 [Neiella marina]
MKQLRELTKIEPVTKQQELIKRAFMPYSEPVDVTGDELNALVILLNLSLSKPACKDYLDVKRAKSYFEHESFFDDALGELEWAHSHNLKYPDSRVFGQRIIAEHTDPQELGWAHNSGYYRHTIWLFNTFLWEGRETSLMKEVLQGDRAWHAVLKKLGLNKGRREKLADAIRESITVPTYPDEVSPYSPQVQFPFGQGYVSVTPVVSHAQHIQVERVSRQQTGHRFVSSALPHPASVGNLSASIGGNHRLLFSPLQATHKPQHGLLQSRKNRAKYFDDYQLTNRRICNVLAHLCGYEPALTRQDYHRARNSQVKILRKHLALWLLPMIELRDQYEETTVDAEELTPIAKEFIQLPTDEITRLGKALSQHAHLTLQNNKYSKRFAFHGRLIQPIRTQINWILKQFQKTLSTASPSTEQYIYLTEMRAEDCNAQSSPSVVGLPSLTAFWGFMHQFERGMRASLKESEELSFISFALVVRSERLFNAANLAEPQSVAKKRVVSAVKRPTTRCNWRSDLEFDLVIKVHTNIDLAARYQSLHANLPLTLAGGSVFPPELKKNTSWLRSFSCRSELFFLLKGIDCSARWVYATGFHTDSFYELLNELERDESFIATASGYQHMHMPCERRGSVSSMHSYADNLLGIAKALNPIEVRLLGQSHFFSSAFWRMRSSHESILIEKDQD